MTEWLEQRTVFEGAILTVKSGRIRAGNGQSVTFDIVEHHGGVAVVPLHGDRIILVRQPRPVVGRDLLEIPAGKLEGAGEDLAARAQAELAEEAGYRAGRLIRAAEFFVSPGYTTERIVIYLGLELEEVGANPESTEEIERVEIDLDTARRMLEAGEFHDGKTIIGLRALFAFLDAGPSDSPLSEVENG